MINISGHIDNAGGRNDIHMKHYLKEKFRSWFLIRKALCEVSIGLEYYVMPELIRRNAQKQVSKFDKCNIVAYRKYELLFCDIACKTGQNWTTFMRIRN